MELIPREEEGLRLFYNENLFLPSSYYEELLRAVEEGDIRYYPTPWAERLTKGLSSFLGVDEEEIMVGAGADDLLRTVILNSRCVGVVEPTYSLYEYLVRSLGRELRVLTKDKLPSSLGTFRGCDTVILNSPNNPTGDVYEEDLVLELAEVGSVVVDEAYVEFQGGRGMLDLAREGAAIILRTFSKAWGLAGLRVGYAVASPSIIEKLKERSLPYQVSAASEAMALRALEQAEVVRNSVEEMRSVREWFQDELESMGLLYGRSQANFVLIVHPRAKKVWEALRREGLVTRFVSRPGLKEGVRITVAPRPIMEQALEVIEWATRSA